MLTRTSAFSGVEQTPTMKSSSKLGVVMAALAAAAIFGAAWLGGLQPLAQVAALAQPQVAELPANAIDYTPPVDAPIIDPFRPPETFAGPGNRGLEYGVETGTPIMAAGDGVVAFAGQVGGSLFVTISHADGIDTTYSYLSEVHVAAGEGVARGQVIGLSGATFHFGAKVGEAYLDPQTLFAASGPDGASVLQSGPVSAGRAILLPT